MYLAHSIRLVLYVCHGNFSRRIALALSIPISTEMATCSTADGLAFRYSAMQRAYLSHRLEASLHRFVIYRMDLHMRTLIADRSRRLWIIYWANASAFPPSPRFEYAQMSAFERAAGEFSPLDYFDQLGLKVTVE